MIPVLLRGVYLYVLRLRAKRKGEEKPEWHFPWVKLGICGLVLAVISVFVSRLVITEDDFHSHREAPQQHYAQEK